MIRKLFITLAFLSSLGSSFAGEDFNKHAIGPFSGLNNRDNSYAIPAANAQDLLNVDLTQNGKSVKKRKGYGVAYSLTVATSPVHGVYTFFDASGNTVDLFANDSYFSASISGATPVVLFSNGSNGATYQCTDSLGYAYCANSQRTNLIKTNGASYSLISSVTSTGTMVTACPTRLAMAGFSDRPSAIDFSADSDFATWGTGSLGSSAVQLTVNSPGPKITMIAYAFGRLMWFKNSSFGYVLIGNQPFQTDWVIRTISYDVGTNDNSYIYREGILYFRGQDSHYYSFDGSNYQRISKEIASTVGLSQTRGSNSWTQTSQSDFEAGISTPPAYLSFSASPGSIVLSTPNVIISQTDTSGSDFSSGSLTNTTTSIVSGSLTLNVTGAESDKDNFIGADNSFDSTCASGIDSAQFTAGSNYALTSVSLRVFKNGSPGNYSVRIHSDSSNTIGTVLVSGTLLASSVTGSPSTVNVPLDNPIQLTSGTKYWISKLSLGTCSPLSNDIPWTSNSTTRNFKTLAKAYSSSGNIVSRVFDVGKTTNTLNWNWCELTANVTGNGQTVTYETQTSSSATGVFESLSSVINGTSPSSTVQRFIRYKASLSTVDTGLTPYLNDVTLNACFIPSYYSAVKNAPFLTSWDSFGATKQDNGGSHTFYIRSSENSFLVNDPSPSWTQVSNGSIPLISTGTYFQIRDDFSITRTTQNPSLDSFTQNWFEGIASDKMYSTYFDDRLWFSFTYGLGASSNNRILVFDLINQTWLLYDLAANGFYVRQNRLYFGSSLSGTINKYGDSDNDNGSAINAYWKSKDFFADDPFATSEVANISVIGKSIANSSMTVTCFVNGISSTTYTMNLNSPLSNFVGKNKNLAASTVGNTYSVKFGNNAADQPFEIFGIQVGSRPKSWIPTP